MKGMMLLQVEFTGDLEKDRDLLLLGMGGLLVLALSSLLILIFVLLRRRKNRPETQKLPVTPAEKPLTAESNPQEETPVTEITTGPEKEQSASPSGQKENSEREKAEPETEAAREPSPEEKLEEIRRRLDEIRKNPGSGPTPVLRKIEAKKRAAETANPAVEEADKKTVAAEEIKGPESISGAELPSAEVKAEQTPAKEHNPSLPTENPDSGENKKEGNRHAFAANKNLPMKKLTFAEWVELFKDPDKINP
jgi:hypothetical protein